MSTLWPLFFLLLIPYLWWVPRKTRVDLSAKHIHASRLIRSGIVVLLAFAMTQPVIYFSGSPVSVIYLLDISQSVLPAEIESAIEWVQLTNSSGNPDHTRYIPFGANARVFETLDQLKAVNVAEDPGDDAIGQSATNIEGAVEKALQNFPPHHLKRLVLITDGNENLGHMSDMISRLKTEGVR